MYYSHSCISESNFLLTEIAFQNKSRLKSMTTKCGTASYLRKKVKKFNSQLQSTEGVSGIVEYSNTIYAIKSNFTHVKNIYRYLSLTECNVELVKVADYRQITVAQQVCLSVNNMLLIKFTQTLGTQIRSLLSLLQAQFATGLQHKPKHYHTV